MNRRLVPGRVWKVGPGLAIRLATCGFTLIGIAELAVNLAFSRPREENSELCVLGEVDVTGSRIKRESIDGSTLVTTLSAFDFQVSDSSTTEELLNTLQQFVPCAGRTSVLTRTSLAMIDLRGFGALRNLVSINGRRFIIADTLQRTDINIIP